MKWKEKLLTKVLEILENEKISKELINDLRESSVNVHLAIFSEPFLTLLFSGEKKIESRFSINKISPFGKVAPRDIILIKESGGDILGLFRAEKVIYFSNLKQEKVENLNTTWGGDIKWDIDPYFLEEKKSSRFLTLIWVAEVLKIPRVTSNKNDRTSWVTIKSTLKGTLFN